MIGASTLLMLLLSTQSALMGSGTSGSGGGESVQSCTVTENMETECILMPGTYIHKRL